MARCKKCSRDVGCSCNLFSGYCAKCYGSLPDTTAYQRKNKEQPTTISLKLEAPANTEFTQILKSQGLSKEEKLKRINQILEKARQNYDNQIQNSES